MLKFYNKKGKEINSEDWSDLFDSKYKRIGLDTINKDALVSTVWLGLEHGIGDDTDEPLIFESMLFIQGEEQDMVRYTTLEQAKIGHKKMVQKYKKALNKK